MLLPYCVFNLFTTQPLSGSNLIVFSACQDLETKQMQAIAREFMFQRTVFLFPPNNKLHAALLRVFDHNSELHFSSNAILCASGFLAKERFFTNKTFTDLMLVIENQMDNIRCAISFNMGALYAELRMPNIAGYLHGEIIEKGAMADILSLTTADIGFENHHISSCILGDSCFMFVPVANIRTIAKAQININIWEQISALNKSIILCLYTRECVRHDSKFHMRTLRKEANQNFFVEDYGSGTSVAALLYTILQFDTPTQGRYKYRIEQGFLLERNSIVDGFIDIDRNILKGICIAGNVMQISEGTLNI